MEGGAGDDIYKVDAITDVAIEAAGGGHDTVQSTVGFVLGTDVEDLTLLGIAGVKAAGDDGNNVLTGNAGANLMVGFLGDDRLLGLAGSDILDAGGDDDYLDGGLSNDILDGGAGADTLIGGLGDDSLRGGADADVFIFTAGKDVISDFQLGVDELRIASSFWGAHATASSLLAQHATMAVNGVILTFGTTTTISLAGVTDLAALANDILMG